MKKRLILLENDATITKYRNRFVYHFAKQFDGEVVHLCNIRSIPSKKIFEEFSNCTDIAFQSSLVGGSEYQVEEYLKMLMKIKTPINLTMRYMGGDIKEWIIETFEPKELVELSHHNFFELNRMYSDDDVENTKFDFSKETKSYLNKIKQDNEYRNSAKGRKTGRKIKILACTAFGSAFENLPIGEIVDEIDMSASDANLYQGVWVMGNGEPIKLINSADIDEFEIIIENQTSEEIINTIFNTFNIDSKLFSELDFRGLVGMFEDNNMMTVANFICEIGNIPKRGNRQKIYDLLYKHKVK